MFEEICKIKLTDNVTFSFSSIGEIREGGMYKLYIILKRRYNMALNLGDKLGCLTVMDNGEEFNNSDYYQDILQKNIRVGTENKFSNECIG